MRELVTSALELVGVGLTVYGIALVHVPSGLMVGGMALIVIGVLASTVRPRGRT